MMLVSSAPPTVSSIPSLHSRLELAQMGLDFPADAVQRRQVIDMVERRGIGHGAAGPIDKKGAMPMPPPFI
jgi:hypothetical protein